MSFYKEGLGHGSNHRCKPGRTRSRRALSNQPVEPRRAQHHMLHVVTIEEIAQATNKHQELRQLRKLLVNGARYPLEELKCYKQINNQLSVTRDGVIRILMPNALRARVVALAHAEHQGIVRTKRPIRSRVWFEGVDSAVERRVKGCKTCHSRERKHGHRQQRRPLLLTRNSSLLQAVPFSNLNSSLN
jgi:hypothetical protein